MLSRDPELGRDFQQVTAPAGPHWSGVGGLESHFPGALEYCSVEPGVMSRVEFFCCFQGLACGTQRKGPAKAADLQIFTLLKAPLLPLPRFCHVLGVTFWVFLVRPLPRDPPLRLSPLLNTLPTVGYALGRVPRAQDVALIA